MVTEHQRMTDIFQYFDLIFSILIFFRWNLFKLSYLLKMILTNILQRKKYGVVQTVSWISRDFSFLAIELNCSDRLCSKNDMLKVAFVSQNVQSFKKKFTEGNARKSTVSFAFFGYANITNIWKNLHFHVSTCKLLKLASSACARP